MIVVSSFKHREAGCFANNFLPDSLTSVLTKKIKGEKKLWLMSDAMEMNELLFRDMLMNTGYKVEEVKWEHYGEQVFNKLVAYVCACFVKL